MRRMSVDLQRRGKADAGGGTSQARAASRFGPRVRRWLRQVQRQGRASARPRGGARGSGTVLLAAATALVVAAAASAQEYDPPVTTLVTNMVQPSGPDLVVCLSEGQDGLLQGFRTGPNQGGYELTSILLYVRATHESRYMTINAGLYRCRAYRTEIVSTPENGGTYLYGENIDVALTFNTDVYVPEEGSEIGIRVGEAADGPTYRADRYFPGRADDGNHKVDGSLQVTDVEITSRPGHGDGYRFGEEIDVTLTFSAEAFVGQGGSAIAIRVGDGAGEDTYRAARYVSGSGTKRLLYRYRVQFADFDADGISVDVGGAHSGFDGPLPTASPGPGSVPASRHYPGMADDAGHKVDRSVTASFVVEALTISEDGTSATVTVELDPDPDRSVTIPIVVALGDGASVDDYTLSATGLAFARGETSKSLTVTATDDSEDDDGESLELSFWTLPSGVRAGSRASATVTIADDDGATTGQTISISAGRDACIAGLDDVVFDLHAGRGVGSRNCGRRQADAGAAVPEYRRPDAVRRFSR